MAQLVDRKKIMEELKRVIDPELGCSIVDMGLIYEIRIKGEEVEIDMTLTAPSCPLGQVMVKDVEKKIKKIAGIRKIKVNLVFDPPWRPERMSKKLRTQMGL